VPSGETSNQPSATRRGFAPPFTARRLWQNGFEEEPKRKRKKTAMVPVKENLRLGKGAAFVKTKLRRLPLTDAEFEADFWPRPGRSNRRRKAWIGACLDRAFGAVLAMADVERPPTVNDLATLLSHAMSRPLNEGDCQRPRRVYLRNRPEWQELFPHLRELGIDVVTSKDLPRCDEVAGGTR
jgi:hypothetical protein